MKYRKANGVGTSHLDTETQKKIIADRINHNLSYRELAVKYNTSFRTIGNVVKKFLPGNVIAPFDPVRVEQRKHMDALERTIEVKRDAASVVEMSMALMSYKLERDLEIMKMNNENVKTHLNDRDITAFFAEAAPYVLEKKSVPGKKPVEETPVKQLHKMFLKKTGNE